MKRLKTKYVILLIILILGLLSLLFDKEISLFFYSLHNNFFDSLAKPLIYLQIPTIIFGLIIMIITVVFFLKKEKIKWIFRIVFSFLITSGIAFLIKEIVDRARPYLALNLPKPPLDALGSSFPSAHAAVVFAMLPFFEKEYPKAKYLWIIFALLICFIRIYFPIHYLSDILFGALIGYLIGHVFCNMKRPKIKKRK